MTADPAELRQRPHYVYRVYGRRGRLLYVGCTSNLDLRKRDHRSWSGWWPLAHRWAVEGPYSYQAARILELAAIHLEVPQFNRTGRRPNYNPRRAQVPA